MDVEFDPAKSEANRDRRGLPFSMASNFEFEKATINRDVRFAYPEARYLAIGPLGDMICALVFARSPNGIHVISLRKASRKERRVWLANPIPG